MSSCWIKPTGPASETFLDPDSVTQYMFFLLCVTHSLISKPPMSRVRSHVWTGLGSVPGSGQVLQLQTFPWGSYNLVWWEMWKQVITPQGVGSLGNWLGWVSGNARRGDMEQACARSSVGRKGTWEECTANAKARRPVSAMVRNRPAVWLEKWVKESIVLTVSHGTAESRELAIFNVNTPRGISSGAPLSTQHSFCGLPFENSMYQMLLSWGLPSAPQPEPGQCGLGAWESCSHSTSSTVLIQTFHLPRGASPVPVRSLKVWRPRMTYVLNLAPQPSSILSCKTTGSASFT